MNRVLILIFFLCAFAGCSQQTAAPQSTAATGQPSVAATPSVSPSVMAIAPLPANPSPGNAVMPPLVPSNSKDGGKQAKAAPKPQPPDLWQRMTRPLSLEEINNLKPETRDMILRAQGRLPASPAPKKK